MAVGGVGGLFGQLINPGLDMDIARQMTPNPNPLAQQGPGGVGPKSVDSLGNAVPNPSQQPPLAPGAFTQPDPVNASYNANLIKAAQRDAYGADLNRNIEGIAAGFGTAQQQASKQNAIRQGQGGVGGGLSDLMNIQKMQDQTIADNEHARFQANAAVFARIIGKPIDQATEIMNGGATTMAPFMHNLEQPEAVKAWNAARDAIKASHPGITPEQLDQMVPPQILALGAGGSQEDQQYITEKAAAMAAGKPFPGYTEWSATQAENAKIKLTAGQDKINAISSFHTIEPTLSGSEANIEWLNDPAHHAAVVKAIQTPELFTTDVAGNVIAKTGIGGIDQDVLSARSKINWLKKNLYADRFAGTKNIRSNTEANNLGAAASNLDTRTNSEDDITTELNRLLDNVYTSHGNLYASSGKTVPKKYDGLVDSTFLDKSSPLYNNGSQEPAEEPPSDILKKAQARIAANPDERDDLVRFFRRQGFKTDKL